MDKIVGIKINNIRTIKSLEMSIDPINVLIGENGAGKSTIIDGLGAAKNNGAARLYAGVL